MLLPQREKCFALIDLSPIDYASICIDCFESICIDSKHVIDARTSESTTTTTPPHSTEASVSARSIRHLRQRVIVRARATFYKRRVFQ